MPILPNPQPWRALFRDSYGLGGVVMTVEDNSVHQRKTRWNHLRYLVHFSETRCSLTNTP